MAHWLLKSEPDEWSWGQQVAEGKAGRVDWDPQLLGPQ
jgi:predicted RNA-binding protein with PUA-like domain